MVTPARAQAVICGAGVAGLSTAWHLAVGQEVRDILIVDPRPPLTLTSDKSTECYRNWWPDGPMLALMNRSIELLDEWAERFGNPFALNRNGYLFVTATSEGERTLRASAERISSLGAGDLRVHERGASAVEPPTWDRPVAGPEGADLVLGSAAIRSLFPWAAPDSRAALWARRCGWLSAQQLGMFWLERAREAGARLIEGEIVAVETRAGQVCAVEIARAGGPSERVETPAFVDAAGPFAGDIAELLDVKLPLFHELHRKVFFDDHLGLSPREAPLVIWNDAVAVDWSEEERAGLLESDETRALAETLPAGIHFRPEGGRGSRSVILLWNYETGRIERRFPIPEDPLHVQVVVRGIARALPAFAAYAESGRRPYVDGGYYTKTRENRPLIGPIGPRGAFLIGALSGFGIMASPAAGELVAAYVAGRDVPHWATAFRLERYQNEDYLRSIERVESGQL